MYLYCVISVLVAMCSVLACTEAAPATVREISDKSNTLINGTEDALLYLSKYGYLDLSARNPESGAMISEDAVRTAILEFQEFAKLNQTGELDEETLKMMNTPRCGDKDKYGYGSATRRKRHAKEGARWPVHHTYQITKYPNALLDRESIDRDISQAFKIWEEATDQTFNPASSNVQIDIQFDDIGGNLAHAFFPLNGGDAHVDDSEKWIIDSGIIGSETGTKLIQVAAHEVGHSLGLGHSSEKDAVMSAFNRGYLPLPNFSLHEDDIDAIKAFYGENLLPSTTKVSPGLPEIPSTTEASPGLPEFLATTKLSPGLNESHTEKIATCVPACINGACLSGLLRDFCYCDQGWTGKQCDIRECPHYGLFEEIGGNCYYFSSDHVEVRNWTSARNFCKDIGDIPLIGKKIDLAELGSEDTYRSDGLLMQTITKKGKKAWLGGSDEGHEGSWKWVSSGHSLSMLDSLWGDDEPNSNNGQEENCLNALIWGRHKRAYLNDDGCSRKMNFVCQIF